MPLQTIARDISVADSQNLDSFSKVRASEVTIQSYVNFKYGGYASIEGIDFTAVPIGGQFVWTTQNRGLGIGRTALVNVNIGIRVPTLSHYTAGTTLKTYITFKINDASLITGSGQIYVGAGDYSLLGQLDCGFVGIVIVNSVYSIRIAQTNLVGSSAVGTYSRSVWDDKLDGTGKSGINLDFSKIQILFVKQQSGRNGQITVGFVVDGEEVVALKVKFTNSSVPLPLSDKVNVLSTFGPCAGLLSTGTGGAIGTVLTFYEGVSITEDSGRHIPLYYQFSHTTVTSSIPSGSFKRIVTYRLDTLGDSSFFTKIILSELEIMSTGNDGFYWELRYSEAGSNALMTAINSNSNLQYETTTTITNGFATVITGGFVNVGEKSNITLPESISNCYPIQNSFNFLSNTHRTISLWIKPFSTSTSSIATMTYKEIK